MLTQSKTQSKTRIQTLRKPSRGAVHVVSVSAAPPPLTRAFTDAVGVPHVHEAHAAEPRVAQLVHAKDGVGVAADDSCALQPLVAIGAATHGKALRVWNCNITNAEIYQAMVSFAVICGD